MRQYLEIGKAVSTHGIAGEVKLYPWCDSAEVLIKIKKMYLDEKGRVPLEALSVRIHKNMVLIKFDGFNSVNDARKLLDRIFYADRDDVAMPEGSYFVADLVGIKVVDAQDDSIVYGQLCDVTQGSAQDLYHVALLNGKTGMIPAVREIVQSIDAEAGEMRVCLPEGLFDHAY